MIFANEDLRSAHEATIRQDLERTPEEWAAYSRAFDADVAAADVESRKLPEEVYVDPMISLAEHVKWVGDRAKAMLREPPGKDAVFLLNSPPLYGREMRTEAPIDLCDQVMNALPVADLNSWTSGATWMLK